MDKYIFDGEPHALDKEYGYIITRIYEKETDQENLQDQIHIHVKKFAEYLYQNDKERTIECLLDGLSYNDYEVIYRPAHIVSVLAQFSTLAIKFKRSKNDNLDIKSDKD
jgi:hypothetical protein